MILVKFVDSSRNTIVKLLKYIFKTHANDVDPALGKRENKNTFHWLVDNDNFLNADIKG